MHIESPKLHLTHVILVDIAVFSISTKLFAFLHDFLAHRKALTLSTELMHRCACMKKIIIMFVHSGQ